MAVLAAAILACSRQDSAAPRPPPEQKLPPGPALEQPPLTPAPAKPAAAEPAAVKPPSAATRGEACGDCRDDLIGAYRSSGRTFECADFTKSRGGEFFPYAQLQGHGFCDWSLIRDPLIATREKGYGLQMLRYVYGEPRQINSAYRDPVHNQKTGGAPRSRHLVGDAADIRNEAAFKQRGASPEAYAREWAQFLQPGDLEDRCLELSEKPEHLLAKPCGEWLRMKQAAEKARANYIEPLNLPCKLDCLHADWRDVPGGYR